MAENLVVNGVVYNGVDSISMQNENGEKVPFYPDAVRYNAQTLTEEQKAQARKNIGVTATGGGSGIHIGPEAPTDESINVWIDTDEEAEAPSGGNGSVIVESAPADWNAAEGQPGHVLNRTHCIETVSVNPVFDGNLTGREKILADVNTGAYAVKISPQSVSVDELIGATMVLNMGGAEQSMTLTAEMAMDSSFVLGVPGAVVLQGTDPIVLSLATNSIIQGASFSAGTWFMCIPGAFYVESVSCLPPDEREVVHKLDGKYLPDYLPRLETNETVFFPEDVYPSEGAESISDPENFTNFTGIIEVGKKYIVNFDGTKYEVTGTACSNEAVVGDFSGNGENLVYLGNVALVANCGGIDDTFDEVIEREGLDTGEPFCFFAENPGEGYAYLYMLESYGASKENILFGINKMEETIHKMSGKYLPDGVPKVETKVIDTTFGGIIGERENILLDASTNAYAVKISPKSVSVDELIGATMVLNMGTEYQTVTITAEEAADTSSTSGVPGAMVMQGSNPVVISLTEDFAIAGNTLSAGTWFMHIPYEFHAHSLSCLPPYEEEIVHKLDNKFLPPIGINSEPFSVYDAYGEGAIVNGGYFYFKASDAMKEQMAAGVIAVKFAFTPIGATKAEQHEVPLVGNARRSFGMFTSGETLYFVEISLAFSDTSMYQLSVQPMKSRRGGGSVHQSYSLPITEGPGGYYSLSVDENGNVVSYKLS